MLRSLWHALTSGMSSWHQGKLLIEHSLPIAHDALHVLFGLLFWVALALLLRRPLTDSRPWLWLLAVTLWNETVDLWIEHWPDAGKQYGESAKDVLLSVAAPTIIMLVARWRPDLFRAAAGRRRR